MPLRKGSSASLTFSSAFSTSFVLAWASETKCLAVTHSRCSLIKALTASSFSWDFLERAKSLLRAAFRAAGASLKCFASDFSMVCIFLKTSRVDSSNSLMASSERRSLARGAALCSTLTTSLSSCLSFSSSSNRICLLLMRRSPPEVAFLCFLSSVSTAFKRSWSLESSLTSSWEALASVCFLPRVNRASTSASIASFSTIAAWSKVALSLSVVTSSRLSNVKSFVISASVWFLASASLTFSTASCKTFCTFRLAVSFLKSTNFWAACSTRPISSFSSSATLLSLDGLRFAVSSLCLTKLLACPMAMSA
mmetsp:Transcript_7946/g.14489  ORF Transcript_7946/g.14489 Transcript_7946/m.14489 type:complete len:309 (-) Transcript_7946:339-1265(-)